MRGLVSTVWSGRDMTTFWKSIINPKFRRNGLEILTLSHRSEYLPVSLLKVTGRNSLEIRSIWRFDSPSFCGFSISTCLLTHYYITKNKSIIVLIIVIISNGNRTGWSPIRSVIVRVINTRFNLFNHDYDYRPNWTIRSSVAS